MEEQFGQPIDYAQQQQQELQNEPVQQEIKYAGFWIRVAANMADGIVVSIIMAVLIISASLIFGLKGFIVAYILAIFLSISYFVYMTTKYQATLGKKLVGIIVLTGNGDKAGVGKIILRELVGKLVSSIIFSIGYIMAGFTQRKRALHDMIANTVVIYKNPSQKIKTSMIFGVIVSWLVISGLLGYVFSIVEKNVLPSQAQSQAPGGSINFSYSSTSTNSAAVSNPGNLSPQVADVQIQNPASNDDIIDKQAENKMQTILAGLVLNFSQNKTYKGFALTDDLAMPINDSTCVTKTKLDIAPDGQSFVIHRPICATALTQSFCIENGTTSITQVNTGLVEKTYHCASSASMPVSATNNPAAGSGSFSVSSAPAPASSQTQTGSATSIYPIAISNKNPITYDACTAQGGEEQSSFIDCSGISLGIDSSSKVNGQSVYCCK